MKSKLTAIALVTSLGLTACANMAVPDMSQMGTAGTTGLGALAGAAAGAAIGRGTAGGNKGRSTSTGALAGAAIGALGGYVWSQKMQDQKVAMEKATAGTGVQVTQTQDNQLKLNIPSDISFDTNRADVKSNFRPVLDQFAQTLAKNPVTQVKIVGFTDSTGNDAINHPLSVNRAASTRDYLVARNVAPNRIYIEGQGASNPIAPNDTDVNRARNRRVEIFVAEEQAAANAPMPTR